MNKRSFAVLGAAVLSASLLAACSGSSSSPSSSSSSSPEPGSDDAPPSSPPAGSSAAPDDAPPADMKPLAAAVDPSIVSTLTAAGLDVNALPPTLDAIAKDETKIKAVMRTFTRALGVECSACHAQGEGGKLDFSVATEATKVSAKMWSELVVKLATKDGGAVYCDTCHEGKKDFIDRKASEASLGKWMRDNFVGKLSRKGGGDVACATCHGEPFRGPFLDDWRK